MEPQGTPTGETVTPSSPSNDGNPTATPAVNAVDPAEAERLRKELDQARLRANQLENEAKKRLDSDDAARKKQLEEKEEFRTLYEQTQSRLKEMEDNQNAQERAKELEQASAGVLSTYSEQVQTLAKTVGLGLSEDSDAARAVLKEKLDVIAGQVGGPTPSVRSNNPANPAPDTVDRGSLTARQNPGAESPMALAGARGDNSVAYKYIGTLPAIQRMKEIANKGA